MTISHEKATPDVAALIEEAKRTSSPIRHHELTRKVSVLLSEERHAAGSVEAEEIYIRQVGAIPLLSAAQERLYFEVLRDGSPRRKGQARDTLIESHLRLVVAIAREYRGMGLPFLDLIQEGNTGLEKAVDRFDLERGNRLSTYAIRLIRATILRALQNLGRAIRVPVSVQPKLTRISRAGRYYQHRFGREPTSEELAWETKLPVEEIEWLRRHTTPPVPLDGVEGGRGDLPVESATGETALSPEEEVIERDLEGKARAAMAHLPARQRLVLELRFGFGLKEPSSLEEVGKQLGLSRERVRQIEGEALERLRALVGE